MKTGGWRAVAAAAVMAAAGAGCGRFEFRDRVLHRVASPDGQVVAVCQEVPEFDGPSFDVRLERPDGTRLRELYHMGDGGGCSEMAWAQDGRMLAVLTGHVARIGLVDVQWALAHREVVNSHPFVRGFSFSAEGDATYASRLRFVTATELEFELCSYSVEETQGRRGEIRCAQTPHLKRLRVPVPLVAARPD